METLLPKQLGSKFLSDCCKTVKVENIWDNADVVQAAPQIFTTYNIEEGTLNGRAHYLSGDGNVAIAYCAMGKWMIQPAEKR